MKNKVYFEDAELRVVDIKKGYAIVLESRWHTYGYNAIVERYEMTLSNAKKVKNDLEKENNLEYLIIDCNDEKYKPIDSPIYDGSSKFEKLKKHVETVEPDDYVERRIDFAHNRGDITDEEYEQLLNILWDRYADLIMSFSDSDEDNDFEENFKSSISYEDLKEKLFKLTFDDVIYHLNSLYMTVEQNGIGNYFSFEETLKLFDEIVNEGLKEIKDLINQTRQIILSDKNEYEKRLRADIKRRDKNRR